MRVTIGAKIFAGFLVVLVSFAGVSGYALYRLGEVRENFQLVSRGYLKLALLVSDLELWQIHLVKQVQSVDPAGKHEAAQLGRHTELVRRQRLDRALRATELAREAGLADLAHTLDGMSQHFRDMDGLYAEGVWDRIQRRESKLRHDTTDLKRDVSRRVQRLSMDLEEEESRQVWWLLGMTVLALLVGAVVTFGAHFTLRPLLRMTARVRRIARGEEPLGDPFPVRAHDEIGDLAEAWNQMAAALREREERLVRSERLAAVGRMAAHITHEVRNPLSSIGLNAELLEEELAASGRAPSAEARRLLGAIGTEVDRLTAITEEYLRFARLPRPRLEREDLAELARAVLDFVRGDIDAAGVRLEARLEPAPANADGNQIRQALLNLIRNALEATPAGGSLAVATARAGDSVELRVIDSGAGISDEVAARIFEPFFTTKDRGTGLGLALCQQIVLEHGGTIRCERVPAGGTAFIVRLPATAEAAPASPTAAAPAPADDPGLVQLLADGEHVA